MTVVAFVCFLFLLLRTGFISRNGPGKNGVLGTVALRTRALLGRIILSIYIENLPGYSVRKYHKVVTFLQATTH